MASQENPRRTGRARNQRWNKFFVDKNESEALKLAKKAQGDQQQFYTATMEKLDAKHQTQVKQLSKQVIELFDNPTTESGPNIEVSDLEELVGCYLPEAKESQDRLKARRQIGSKRVSASVQTFAIHFSGFLACYSDIFGILQTVDNQYGGVAIQTLSLLLVVAVNKQRTEDRFASALASMRNQFPRLKELRDIYPGTKMEQLVANVYKDVLDFSNMAIEYYRTSTWSRVWQAIINPPRLGVDRVVNRILGELSEVKEERDTLLNKRVKELQESVKALDTRLTDVQTDVRNVQNQKDQDLLNELRPYLLVDDFQPAQHLTDHRNQLVGAFDQPPRLHQIDIVELQDRHEYKSWKKSKASSFLLLGGNTRAQSTLLCWLSPLAVQFIDLLHRDGEILAYHFCKVEEYMEADVSMHTVLSRMIYQLLSQNAQLLRKEVKRHDIIQRTKTEKWARRETKSACHLLVHLLIDYGPVYLIFDRLDCCTMGISGLEMLLEMIHDADLMVKILVIMESPDVNDVMNLQSSGPPTSFAISDWNQQKEGKMH